MYKYTSFWWYSEMQQTGYVIYHLQSSDQLSDTHRGLQEEQKSTSQHFLNNKYLNWLFFLLKLASLSVLREGKTG